MRVFVSYRRGDVGGYAGRLTDALIQRLGAKGVFQDVTAIAPGQNFSVAIDHALEDCDAVLAVIGPGWLTASTPEGIPRLQEDTDYVRMEISKALERGVAVVPILVGGAPLPAESDLPQDLRELVKRQAVVLRDESWHQDVSGLIRSLRGEPAAPGRRRRWPIAGAAVILLLAGALWLWWPGRNANSGSGNIPSCAPPVGGDWNSIVLNDDPSGRAPNEEGGSLIFTVEEAKWRAGDESWEVNLAVDMTNETPEDSYHGNYLYEALIVGDRPFGKQTCFRPEPDLVNAGTTGRAIVGFEVPCKPNGSIELMLDDDAARINFTDDPQQGQC